MDRTLFTTLLAYTLTVLMCYLLFTILAPFLTTVVWAGAIGIISYPLYEKLLVRCRNRETLTALLMTTLVVMALIIPVVGLIFTLARETAQAYQYLENVTSGSSGIAMENILRHPLIAPWLERIQPLTGALNMDPAGMLLPAIKKGVASLLNYSTGIVKNFLGFLIKLVLMLITLFFIYRDGRHFVQRFWLVVGIKENLRATIATTTTRVLGAVMYGILLTCLVQGMLGGLGFWIAGLPSPFLFGVLMSICAPIPLVGTALIWLPGAIYLLAQGKTIHGVLLIIWGLAIVSSIDNVIRPLFISGKAKLPILVVVFGVLGGLLVFGLTGVVAGPVIVALFLVFFESYRGEDIAINGND
jgi:predicted PurR-regulated permease PerM